MIEKGSKENKIGIFFVVLIVLFRFWVLNYPTALPYPNGSDWSQYIMGAEVIWKFDPSLHYPTWREPLYPYLLGLFSWHSYLEAALILSTMGWLFSIVGIFLCTTHLGTNIAVLSIVLLSCFPIFSESMHYMNPYPLVGGCLAMVFGSAVAFQQKQRLGWLLCCSIFIGIGFALDSRTLIGSVCTLIWICPVIVKKRLYFSLVGVGIIALPGIILNLWIKTKYQIETLSLFEKLHAQREFMFRDSMAYQLYPPHPDSEWLASICVGSTTQLNGIMDIFSDCSLAMFRINMEAWNLAGLLPPFWLLVLIVVLALQRKEGVLFVCVILAYMSLSLLVWQPSRYVFFIIVPLIYILVLASERISLFYKNWKPAMSFILLGIGVFIWPGWNQQEGFSSRDYPPQWPQILTEIDQVVGLEVPLDCSMQDLGLAKLSAYRSNEWPLLPSKRYCDSQYYLDTFNFILNTQEKDAKGWTTARNWETNRGSVYLHQRR
jgi:hypothetical protein